MINECRICIFLFLLDIIGICSSFGELKNFTARSSGRKLINRDLILIDKSGAAVVLTLWGCQAEKFQDHSNPIIVVLNARVSEFNGRKQVSVGPESSMSVNPINSTGAMLREWFDNGGAKSVKNLNGNNSLPGWMNFHDFNKHNLENRPISFKLSANIIQIQPNNAVYKACPQPNCFKKLANQIDGKFRCSKCNIETSSFEYRLVLNVCITNAILN